METKEFTKQEKERIASSVAFTLSGKFETSSNLMTMDKINMSARDKVLKERAAFCAKALEQILEEMLDYNDEEIEAIIHEYHKQMKQN